MKSTIRTILLAALVLLAFTAKAQVHFSQSFLANCTSFNLSTNVDATYTTTWSTSVPFTNLLGQAVVQTNNTPGVSTNINVTILGDVSLWSDRMGNVPLGPGTNGGAADQYGAANISVTFKGTSAAGAGNVIFEFTPLPDGSNLSTTAADVFTFSVADATTSTVTFMTNFPTWKYSGVKKLRCTAARYQGDADGVITVLGASLNGFVP